MSEPATPKSALHHSMLSTLSRCGMQFFYRYIEGRKEPPGVALVIGTAVHAATAADLVAKMQGAPIGEAEVRQRAAEALEATWDGEGPRLDDDEKARGEATVKGDAKDECVELAAVHHKVLTPVINPISVERKLRLVLPNFPFDLEGTIDTEEEHTIRDRKTSKRAPSGDEANGHPQLQTYAMMRTLIDKRPVKSLVLDYLVKGKREKSAISVSSPAPTDFTPVVRRIELAAQVVDRQAFYPVDPTGPSGWVCTPKFCGYYELCPFGARARVQVPVSKPTE